MSQKEYPSKKGTCKSPAIAVPQSSKAMMTSILIIPLLAVLLAPTLAGAEGVIGVDTTFSINTINFLTSNPEYAQAFNYFFTIELYVGLLAFWARITIRSFRM